MSKSVVTFINGVPGSGKDELVAMLVKKYGAFNIVNVSSIDPVRSLLGISKDDKRPETRRVLSVVGDELELYNGFRTKGTCELILKEQENDVLRSNKEERVIFVHTREQKMINSISQRLLTLDPNQIIFTILMDRPSVEKQPDEYSNASDIEALEIIRRVRRLSGNNIADANSMTTSDSFIDFKYASYQSDDSGHILHINNSGTLEDLQNIADNFYNALYTHIL